MHFQPYMIIAPLLLGTASALPAASDAGLSKRELVWSKLGGTGSLDCTLEQRAKIRKVLDNVKTLTLTALAMKRSDPAYKAYFDEDGEKGKKDVFDNVKGRFQKIDQFVTQSITSLTAGKETSKYEKVEIMCAQDLEIGDCKTALAFAGDASDGYPAAITFCPKFWERVKRQPVFDTKFKAEFSDGDVDFDICTQPTKMRFADFPEITVLHELTHLTALSDGRDRTIDCVYGAYWPTYIAAVAPKVAERNADNYPYMALSKYFGEACGMPGTTFSQSVPYPGQKAESQPMGIEKDYYDKCKLPEPARDALPQEKSKVSKAIDKVEGKIDKIIN